MGWPCIGPCVKDGNMQVRVVAECLTCAEDVGTCAWVIQSIQEMEPRFDLQQTNFMFADQLVTKQLIRDLGIECTCTLRCDCWHIIDEVLPTTFGIHFYTQIRGLLQTMLLGTREQWDACYKEICKKANRDAEAIEKITVVCRDPEYYAGWYLRQQDLNLEMKGSGSAEINHSSLRKHWGKGQDWELAKEVQENRQY